MTKQDLIKIIASIKSSFSQDELAYLAVTSKIENPLRDAVAYNMHLKLQGTESVCREYLTKKGKNPPRIDVACINTSNKLTTLIEFKAHSSIDFPSFVLTEMVEDISKMENYATINNLNPDMYFVYFNNVIRSNTICQNKKIGHNEENDNNPVKYYGQATYNLPNSYKDKVSEILLNWILVLRKLKFQLNRTTIIEIDAGNYYGSEVYIFAFVYEHSYNRNDNMNNANDEIDNINTIEEDPCNYTHAGLKLIYQSSELKDISISDFLSSINFGKKQKKLIKEIGIDYLNDIKIECCDCNTF